MSGVERVEIPEEDAGVRVDRWLAALPSVGSRSRARHVIESGKVTLDGEPLGVEEAGRTLRAGAVLEIHWTRPGSSRRRTAARAGLSRAGVQIVHAGPSHLVVDKPAGLLTDAADGEQRREADTLRKRVSAWAGALTWPAHRIDRDTTGLVVFARSEAVRDELMAQWRERTPQRIYLAVVDGEVAGQQGTWTDWMAWDGRNRVQRPAQPDAEGAFLAEAHWRVRERLRRATLLEVELVSGRRNQIRLQSMLRGNPLVGERLYRADGHRFPHAFGRHALHAWRLAFDDPDTKRRVHHEAPVPEDLRGLLRSLSL